MSCNEAAPVVRSLHDGPVDGTDIAAREATPPSGRARGSPNDKERYPTEQWLCCEGQLVKSTKKCGGKLICPNLNCCKGKAVRPENGCGSKCKECFPPGWNIPGVKCCGGKCVNTGVNRDHCGKCFNKCKPGELCLRTGCGKGA